MSAGVAIVPRLHMHRRNLAEPDRTGPRRPTGTLAACMTAAHPDMPVTQHGENASFQVYGNYNDYGTQSIITQIANSAALPQTKYVYVPPRPLSPRFTGQEKYLSKLREYFKPSTGRTLQRRFLLHGKGGVGKTQLALKFAEENADRFWIFWIDASSSEAMEQSFKTIAGYPVAKAAGVEASTISVQQWLSRMEHDWLLIFDNADGDPNTVSKHIPPGKRGNILFTSRNPMIGHHVSSPQARIEIDAMDEEDAIVLLLRSAMLDDSPSDLNAPARAIVLTLYGLPLAIDQAGAAISSNVCTIHDYLDRYATRRRELLTFPAFEGASDSDRAVYTTWDISYVAIRADASGTSDSLKSQAAHCAIVLLEIFAFLHYENISEDIIRRAAEAPPCTQLHPVDIAMNIQERKEKSRVRQLLELLSVKKRKKPSELLKLDESGKWDPLFFRAGIRILHSFSLIKRSESGDTYFEHPLVHLWSRDRLSAQMQKTRSRLASALLSQSITYEERSSDYAFRRDLIPHIKSCASVSAGPGWTRIYKEEEYIKFAFAYYENGFLKEAEELDVQVLEARKRSLGKEHRYTLTSMTNLARTYSEQGRHKEAEDLEVQVLEARKRTLGEEHPNTLISMGNLASTYSEQGRHKEAEELKVRVVEARKKVLGEEHPHTLISMNNLAVSYSEQGSDREAEMLKVRVLETRKRVLGEEHPDTLSSMGNLATTYSKQGRHKEAEELEVQVLELRMRVLGEEHPITLLSMGNLAWTWRQLGRDQDARELMRRTVDLSSRKLGLQHSRTIELTRILENWSN